MNGSEVAEQFFAALFEERWQDAVSYLSQEFMAEHEQNVRHRFRVRIHHLDEASDQIPDDRNELFALWLQKADFRHEAARVLAEAQREQPDHEFEVVGGIAPTIRRVMGEIPESDDRTIVVYRRGRGQGTPTTLQLKREEGQWRICSEEFASEGYPGLAWKRGPEGRGT